MNRYRYSHSHVMTAAIAAGHWQRSQCHDCKAPIPVGALYHLASTSQFSGIEPHCDACALAAGLTVMTRFIWDEATDRYNVEKMPVPRPQAEAPAPARPARTNTRPRR